MHQRLLDAKGTLLWEVQFDAHSITRGVAVGDVSGDGRADIVFGTGPRLVGLDARDGSEVLSVDLKSSDDPREAIESAPLIFDAVSDDRLEVFVVVGRGLYLFLPQPLSEALTPDHAGFDAP